jgi:hypothetical protein
MPSGLCPYAAVWAELARVLNAEVIHGEERCANTLCLCGYTREKGSYTMA